MKITAKSLQHSNIVFVLPKESQLNKPEAPQVYGLFGADLAKGSSFVDDPAMELKIYSFPALQMKIVFEQNRLRIEDLSAQAPEASRRALEAHRILQTLFPQTKPESFGFNFDIFFRFDNVIPQREIMKSFLAENSLEEIKDFGWQFTLNKDGGKNLETYFFKVIAPIEIALHTNFHYSQVVLPSAEALQKIYEKSFEQVDKIFAQLAF